MPPAWPPRRAAGFPEHVSQTKQALALGYAVLALDPLDFRHLCWSSSDRGGWGVREGGAPRPPPSSPPWRRRRSHRAARPCRNGTGQAVWGMRRGQASQRPDSRGAVLGRSGLRAGSGRLKHAGNDQPTVRLLLREFLTAQGLKEKPLLLLGVSSGGTLALKLAVALEKEAEAAGEGEWVPRASGVISGEHPGRGPALAAAARQPGRRMRLPCRHASSLGCRSLACQTSRLPAPLPAGLPAPSHLSPPFRRGICAHRLWRRRR